MSLREKEKSETMFTRLFFAASEKEKEKSLKNGRIK